MFQHPVSLPLIFGLLDDFMRVGDPDPFSVGCRTREDAIGVYAVCAQLCLELVILLALGVHVSFYSARGIPGSYTTDV